MRSLYFLAAVLAGSFSPAFGQAANCGKPPEYESRLEQSDKLKGDLAGKTQFLSRFLGSADLSGKIETERRELYKNSDGAEAARQDAMLAYMFCNVIMNDRSMSAADKINAIQEFRKPLSKPQSSWTGQVELASAIDNLAIPASAKYTNYGWPDLERRATGIELPGHTTMTDFPACYFRMIGKAKFLIGGRALLHESGGRPVEWDIYACGARSMVMNISFEAQAFTHERVREIFASVRDGLLDKGYRIERVGCDGIMTEMTSLYHITRPSSRPFNLEAYKFDGSVGPTVKFSLSFKPARTLSACARDFDLLQVNGASGIR